eukprot:scaffold74842_cov37-Attheya_sp.AAC.1
MKFGQMRTLLRLHPFHSRSTRAPGEGVKQWLDAGRQLSKFRAIVRFGRNLLLEIAIEQIMALLFKRLKTPNLGSPRSYVTNIQIPMGTVDVAVHLICRSAVACAT